MVHYLPPDRQLTVEVATAHKVAGMFGRRDPMRRYMDKITAMADELGVAPVAGFWKTNAGPAAVHGRGHLHGRRAACTLLTDQRWCRHGQNKRRPGCQLPALARTLAALVQPVVEAGPKWSHSSAGADVAPGAIELPDDVDLDYFDRHDLGRLRRRLRTAVQRFRRERERYLELVLSYIDVSCGTRSAKEVVWGSDYGMLLVVARHLERRSNSGAVHIAAAHASKYAITWRCCRCRQGLSASGHRP